MGNELSQESQRLDLKWTAGDPVSLAFLWPDDNIEGAYTAPIKDAERGGTLVKTMTVTTVFAAHPEGVGTKITFTLSQVDSAAMEIGTYWYSLTLDGGATRLHGKVIVTDGRQV